MSVDWAGIGKIGEKRVLVALHLALQGKSIPDIAHETGISSKSLYDIKLHGPYSHQNKPKPTKNKD